MYILLAEISISFGEIKQLAFVEPECGGMVSLSYARLPFRLLLREYDREPVEVSNQVPFWEYIPHM